VACARSIVYLGKIDLNRALVRPGNRIVGVARELSTANDMAPKGTNSVTSPDVEDGR